MRETEAAHAMLHADLMPHALPDGVTAERRRHARLACPADVIIAWNHALDEWVRLRMINLGEGGMQVAAAHPLPIDATGIAIKLLPEGVALNRVFTVVWVREERDTGGFIAGLRFLG